MRLGTASMLPSGEGPFINLARLNVAKYASQPNIAKALFEYIYYHENDVRHVSINMHQVFYNKLNPMLPEAIVFTVVLFCDCLTYRWLHKCSVS